LRVNQLPWHAASRKSRAERLRNLLSPRFSRADIHKKMLPMPALDEASRAQLVLWGVSIGAAVLAFGTLALRLAAQIELLQWWVLPALATGVAVADFGSGLVHWGADTWGRDDLPVVGRRLLVPFRLHHLNPDDFLRRRFLDTNGDVALLTVPVLLVLHAVPFDTAWGAPPAVFGLGLCGAGMATNQIHQWAHMPAPPLPIRALQACGLVLGRDEHAAHHERPYDVGYCITTGWCNAPLEAIGFFRRLEAAVTWLTGARPRDDDRRYEARYLTAAAAGTRDG
jgi:ubiquitin-conjugating enzyme E2 variant